MPIDTYWANKDKTVIHIISTGQWTWDEYAASDDALRSLLDSVDYPVSILSDTRGIYVPPDIVSHFGRLQKGAVLTHSNVAMNVIVVSNRLLLNLLQSFLRFYRIDRPRQIMVGTREEADDIVDSKYNQGTDT